MLMNRYIIVVLVILLATLDVVVCAKKTKVVDPRECEVCISNLDKIEALIPKNKRTNKDAIETAINKHCTAKGAGSDWKPNPALTTPRDVKMCYIFEPIKKSISQPFSTGMPKEKVCKRLMKDNPEVCEVKYRKYLMTFTSKSSYYD